MNIVIQAVNFDATSKLREFIEKKVEKLDKLSDIIVDAEVVLKVVKPETANNKEASVKLNVKGSELFASKTADSFEEAVVLSVEALERQLKKMKEKMQSK